MNQDLKKICLHAVIVFVVSFGTQLTLASTNIATIPTLVAFIVSSAMAAVLVVAHYLAGLIPSTTLSPGTEGSTFTLIPHGVVGTVALHCVLVFIVSFGGQLADISLSSATYSTLVAFVSSAAITGAVAVASYLSGLVPSEATVAASRARRLAKAIPAASTPI